MSTTNALDDRFDEAERGLEWLERLGALQARSASPKRAEGRTFEISFPLPGSNHTKTKHQGQPVSSQTKPGRRQRNRTPDGCGTERNPTTLATGFAVEQPHW